MSKITQTVDVDVPVPIAFEKLTRWEELPGFLPGVMAVQRIDDRTLRWVGQVLGLEITWLIEITGVNVERLISWRSRSGPRVRGTIWLEPLGDAGTRVTMVLQYDPASLVQEMTDYLGLVRSWVDRSLVRFKRAAEDSYEALSHLPLADELVGQWAQRWAPIRGRRIVSSDRGPRC